jgi:hypothetical protein
MIFTSFDLCDYFSSNLFRSVQTKNKNSAVNFTAESLYNLFAPLCAANFIQAVLRIKIHSYRICKINKVKVKIFSVRIQLVYHSFCSPVFVSKQIMEVLYH